MSVTTERDRSYADHGHFHRLGHLALRLTRGIDMRGLAIAVPLRYDMASFAIFRSAIGYEYK